MGDNVRRAEFVASFPPIQSAIKIDGQGGARIQLDIPESEMEHFLPAMAWRGIVIKVTLEIAQQPESKGLDYRGKLK